MKLAELLRKRTIYEFLFSLYLSVLIISIEEMRWSWSWIIRLRIFSYFNPQLLKPTDDPHPARLIAFLLLWLLVIIIFLCLRLLSRFSSSRIPLDIAAGFVALGGMPTAIWCRGLGNRALLLAQIVLSLMCAFLYVCGKWRGSPRTNLALLALYFIFSTWVAWQSWSTFPLGFFALWPGLDGIFGTYPKTQNIYPLLGVIFGVVWGIHVCRDHIYYRVSTRVSGGQH